MFRASLMLCAVLAAVATPLPIGPGKALFDRFAPTFGGAEGRPTVRMEVPGAAYDVELSDSEVDRSEAEPYMAANGRVRGRDNTDFMMKGTDASLYGWLALEDEGRAFEYTTDADGNVQVDEVPLRRIKPICPQEGEL